MIFYAIQRKGKAEQAILITSKGQISTGLDDEQGDEVPLVERNTLPLNSVVSESQ